MIFLLIAFNLNLDKSEITSGDTLTLTYTFKKQVKYHLAVPDSISDWVKILDTIPAQGRYVLKITGFKPGLDTFPAVKFISQDKRDTISSSPVIFKVKSLLKGKKSKLEDIYKPYSFFNPLLLLYLLIPIILYLTYILLRRKSRKVVPEKVEEEKIESLPEKMEKLWNKAENLLEKGYLKPFYITLSYIIRLYLENIYQFPALEQTTTEIRFALKKKKIPEMEKYIELLNYSDMVKFAKFQPEKESALKHLEMGKSLTEVKNETE